MKSSGRADESRIEKQLASRERAMKAWESARKVLPHLSEYGFVIYYIQSATSQNLGSQITSTVIPDLIMKRGKVFGAKERGLIVDQHQDAPVP